MNVYSHKKPSRINSFTVSATLIGLVVAYFAWFLVPAWWPIFQLTGIMRGACNDAYRVYDDELVVSNLLKSSKRTGLDLTPENFRLTRVPHDPSMIEGMAMDGKRALLEKRGKVCKLQMKYRGNYTWPLFDKPQSITWRRTVEKELKQTSY